MNASRAIIAVRSLASVNARGLIDIWATPSFCGRGCSPPPVISLCGRQLSAATSLWERQLSPAFSSLCVLQKRQVTFVGLVDVGLARHFPGRVHGKHGHARVDDVHAVLRGQIRNRPAAACIDFAQFSGLE